MTLHPEKTRLIEFGRDAQARSEQPDGKKSETFDFLGFTHICARSRQGKFTIHVRTMRKRLRRSLKAMACWCRQHFHDPVEAQWKALNAKLRGHYQYYGRRTNSWSLRCFYRVALRLWRWWLNRRSREKRITWPVFNKILRRYPLLPPRLRRPWCPAGSRV